MAITFDDELYPLYIYRYDSSSGTYSSNLSGISSFDYFNDDANADDSLYFCMRGGWRFPWHNLKFYVGTPLVADDIQLVWEYYTSGTWKTLPNVVDGTNNFQNAGEHWVTWDVPEDPINPRWVATTINGVNGFWVRCRIVSVTNITEGGAQSTQPVTLKNFAITVSGFSEVTPCTLEDIYQADIANGWGRFLKFGDTQYRCDCNLVVGDWTNSGDESWLVIQNKSLVVDGILQIIEYGNFQTGELVDINDKRCRYGSHLHFTRKYAKGSFYAFYASPFKGSYSTIRNRILYSLITGGSYAPYCYSYFFSSIKDGGTILPSPSLAEEPITNRATICSFGHAIDARTGTYEDIYVHDSNRAIRLPNKTTATVRNLKVRNCTYLFRDDAFAGNWNKLYLIDADTDTWAIYFNNPGVTTEMYRQYSVNIMVLDESGSIIDGALVTLVNNEGTVVFSEYTASDGKIAEQIVTSHKYVYESGSDPGISTDFDYNPFTIKISKPGYKVYQMVFTLDKKIDWIIRLSHSSVNVDLEVL